jgi:hypothetical protein
MEIRLFKRYIAHIRASPRNQSMAPAFPSLAMLSLLRGGLERP